MDKLMAGVCSRTALLQDKVECALKDVVGQGGPVYTNVYKYCEQLKELEAQLAKRN